MAKLRMPEDPHAVLRAMLREDFAVFLRKVYPSIRGGEMLQWD